MRTGSHDRAEGLGLGLRTDVVTSGASRTIRPVGDVDVGTAPGLATVLHEALHDPDLREVVVDLAGVRFVGLTGLRILLGARRLGRARRKRVRLSGMSDEVVRLVELADLQAELLSAGAAPLGGRR